MMEPASIEEACMKVTKTRDHGQTLQYPTRKVLGIVDTKAELKGLIAAMNDAGFGEMELLHGKEGIQILKRVGKFFFSDIEAVVINRHIYELQAGHTIVAIKPPPDRVDEAISVASENGARRLVYFGSMAVTWHPKH